MRLARSLKLALVLLVSVTTATLPSAMLLGGMARPAAAVAAHHHSHSAPGSHSHTAAATCCDLCVLACSGCPAIAGTVPVVVRAPAARPISRAAVARAPLQSPAVHRLPFSIGPPAFRIA
jgi:hypothetical protein